MEENGYSSLTIGLTLIAISLGILYVIFRPNLNFAMFLEELQAIGLSVLVIIGVATTIGLVITFPLFFFAILVIIPLWVIAMKE